MANMESNENQEFIAYEMALLVKENRELRGQLEYANKVNANLKDKLIYLEEEIYEVKEEIRKEKRKNQKLYNAPHDIPKGSNIVVTQTINDKSKFPTGFVLQVKNITKNDKGLVTVYGKYLHDGNMWDTIINNRYYNWEFTTAELSEIFGNPEPRKFLGLIGFVHEIDKKWLESDS